MKTYLVGGDEEFANNVKDVISDVVEGTVLVQKNTSPEFIKENLRDCEILVASPSAFEYLSDEHLANMPDLKFITTISVGTDWIDLESARQRGVLVSNEKGVNSEAVAEHCFGMILDLTKRITEADRGLREGILVELMQNDGLGEKQAPKRHKRRRRGARNAERPRPQNDEQNRSAE